MRLLLLLAASHGLQPLRGTRPRTQLQVAQLPDAPHSVEIPIKDGAPLILETGRIGRQADAAVIAKRGGTTVYATLCVGDTEGGGDFLPMSVDYQERYSATGRTSGAYNKRDGRASDGEILTCRLIDRPLRPSVVDGFCGDVQVLAWVLSYDGADSASVSERFRTSSCVDGVVAMLRESTRLVSERRQCRDGVRATQVSTRRKL